MSRRRAAQKRPIFPDVKYNSELVSRFINKITKEGKKALAEKIIYKAFDNIAKKYKIDALEAFNTAIQNVKPFLELTSVRVGGANYQVPCPVDELRGHTLALRWIIAATDKRSEKTMIERLSGEIFDAYNNRGIAVKKKEDTHKMAEANKAFAHFSPKKNKLSA